MIPKYRDSGGNEVSKVMEKYESVTRVESNALICKGCDCELFVGTEVMNKIRLKKPYMVKMKGYPISEPYCGDCVNRLKDNEVESLDSLENYFKRMRGGKK